MRIALVIWSLARGGSERVLVHLAQQLRARHYRVTVITLSAGEDDGYLVPGGVDRVRLGVVRRSRSFIAAVVNNLGRLRALRRALCDADIAISFGTETNVLVLLAVLGRGLPVVVSERCEPSIVPSAARWRWARRLLYPLAAQVVVQTEHAAGFFRWLRSVAIIPNPATVPRGAGADPEVTTPPRPYVVAMGRLVPQKGFDLLLTAFARIVARHRTWSLVILGEGPERAALQSLRGRLGLDGRVLLPGAVRDPAQILQGSDLFVLSSRFEGFPNALCEAMACGIAVVSTDCPSGPRDIVRDGVDGLLVRNGDVASLAAAMDRLMAHERLRRRMAARAVEVAERFSLEKVMARWEDVMEQALEKRARRRAAGREGAHQA